ncbi:hypothetical protein CgunFtcFv8_017264 [Champsocephalus gunnari]|uniref:Uncharacterized protein n=1 Tax=Champsocephalus gunnari TaxID=52237 RepID=A0AAN8DMW4_CHAGU|nr:hypothetical protein CgunFtcFv8_017264 [Champsocephalus gunnari]
MHVGKLEVRAHQLGISERQLLRFVLRDTILGHLIHKENRNPSPLFSLSSKPAVDKRLFDSCRDPGSRNPESANLPNKSMWMRVRSNGLLTAEL